MKRKGQDKEGKVGNKWNPRTLNFSKGCPSRSGSFCSSCSKNLKVRQDITMLELYTASRLVPTENSPTIEAEVGGTIEISTEPERDCKVLSCYSNECFFYATGCSLTMEDLPLLPGNTFRDPTVSFTKKVSAWRTFCRDMLALSCDYNLCLSMDCRKTVSMSARLLDTRMAIRSLRGQELALEAMPSWSTRCAVYRHFVHLSVNRSIIIVEDITDDVYTNPLYECSSLRQI